MFLSIFFFFLHFRIKYIRLILIKHKPFSWYPFGKWYHKNIEFCTYDIRIGKRIKINVNDVPETQKTNFSFSLSFLFATKIWLFLGRENAEISNCFMTFFFVNMSVD